MANRVFRYSPESCRYEPVVVTPARFAKQALRFFLLCVGVACAGAFYVNYKFPGWDEQLLERENRALKAAWALLGTEIEAESKKLAQLEKADDENYRTILDLEPLPLSVRQAGVGGHERVPDVLSPSVRSAYTRMNGVLHRAEIQAQSLGQLAAALNEKEKSWASRPAIQPISNKELTKLHTTYGMRWNPGGFWRPHKGLDFSAPAGTPVYATGDGKVTEAHFSDSFGRVVYLDHQFGFSTRYAHLSEFAVAVGDGVKRGQIIGYVGDTGHSFGNHLHYEVLFRGDQVNPINFFQRDLSQREFEKMIELAGKSMTSLD
jgi:murein DD-endopeptidase MepM/ murein hydrolase activator NlpD